METQQVGLTVLKERDAFDIGGRAGKKKGQYWPANV